MANRPTHIEIDNDDFQRPTRPQLSMDLPSPRAGEAPPALSPLDAFAMQSRLLAKRFEESSESGKRISRLRHSDVAREIANRSDYFRSLYTANQSISESTMDDLPELPEESSPQSKKGGLVSGETRERPTSHYPVFGHATKEDRNDVFAGQQQRLSTPFETPMEYAEDLEDRKPAATPVDYFGSAMPRAASPEAMDKKMINVHAASPLTTPSLTNSVDSFQSTPAPPRTLTNGSTHSQRSLAPPKSPALPKSPRSLQSIRSVPPDSGDEDGSMHAVPLSRKFSGSSGMSRSRPQSPYSPYMNAMPRSPSTMSDYSVAGSQRRNFSRPMSSGGSKLDLDARPSLDSRSSFDTRPSTDLPPRGASAASGSIHSGPPSRKPSEDDVGTPFAIPLPFAKPPGPEGSDSRPSTSYTYTKFPLPRGRDLERNSKDARESWIQKQFDWDNQHSTDLEPPPVPKERTNSDGAVLQPVPSRTESPIVTERKSLDRRARKERDAGSPVSKKRSQSVPKNRNRSLPRTIEKANALHKSTPSVRTAKTDSTDRTIKAIPLHQRSPSAELTPDEHLDIGIESHSDGELNKSTYHFRLAAKAGLPTGMLLYALACRHGWGMRPNQEEGVKWLRQAIDSAGLEVADVEATLTATTKPNADPVAAAAERRKRKAQFALAVYELGISYMNGWGCQKDKQLGLSCFEMAGNWGDCDALAEAAFCYTGGNGCKKDLKKAAQLYRKAAEGGMSMAGNSW